MIDNTPTRKTTLTILFPALIFAVISSLLYVALGEKAAKQNSVATESESRPAPAIRAFTLDDATKPAPSLEQWRGQKIIVNFFASWCTPCLVEHPLLQKLAVSKHYKIYGIAWKDEAKNIKTYLTEHGNPYDLVALDPQSTTAIDYGIHGVPESFIIDENGIIVTRIAGPLTEDSLKTLMEVTP